MATDLQAAYQNAEYRVPDRPELLLRIGEANPALLAAHQQHGVSSSLFLTAWNPYSQSLQPSENHLRQQQLVAQLDARGLTYWLGVGVDPQGKWPGEDSLLIFGVTREEAIALGHQFEQNAVVWSGRDAVPQLVMLHDPDHPVACP